MKRRLNNYIQKYRDAAITNTTATVVTTMIASCSVVMDPLIYIINHKKYRRAILNMLSPKTFEENSSRSEGFTSTTRVSSVHGKVSTTVQMKP